MLKGKRRYLSKNEEQWLVKGAWNRVSLQIRFGKFTVFMREETKAKAAPLPGDLPEGEDFLKEETGKHMVASDGTFPRGKVAVGCSDCEGTLLDSIHLWADKCFEFPDLSKLLVISPKASRWHELFQKQKPESEY